ncbi:eukaryotic translation initiation factor 3 subunit E [Allomyces javanicus]|nr:eukaryotic translation initiation factor 3 subunit E [Allomyces javanicus]
MVSAAAQVNTATIAPFLDRQLLVLPLRHLADNADVAGVSKRDVLEQLFAVVNATANADLASQIADEIVAAGGKKPALDDVKARSAETLAAINNVDEDVSNIFDVLAAAAPEDLRAHDRVSNSNYVQDNAKVTVEAIDKVFHYGQLYYQAGQYAKAAEILDQYRRISTNDALYLAAMWGKLAALILANDDGASDALHRLRDAVENASLASPSHTLQQRAWLLHWTLFVHLRTEAGLPRVQEFFATYQNVVETACPWLVRYVVAAAALTGKNTRDAARLAVQERYRVTDPVASVLENLLVSVDLDAAADALKDVEAVAKADYFLAPHADALVAALRKQVFQVLANVYTQLPVARAQALLHVGDDFDWQSVATDVKGGVTVEKGMIVFAQAGPARRGVLEKMDKLSHRSDNTMAMLFKKQ